MSKNSKVINRKSFCKDVELHMKWHGVPARKAIKIRREADNLAQQYTLQTCSRWFKEYSVDKNVFNYENAVAVTR